VYLRDFAAFWLGKIGKSADEKSSKKLVEFVATASGNCASQRPDNRELEQTLQPEKYLQHTSDNRSHTTHTNLQSNFKICIHHMMENSKQIVTYKTLCNGYICSLQRRKSNSQT